MCTGFEQFLKWCHHLASEGKIKVQVQVCVEKGRRCGFERGHEIEHEALTK